MEIKANVHSITKLKDYFFLVPDYQREYVWKVDDHVEQFLEDIDNEYDEAANQQQSYFIGSIILVENGGKYDVIDGQQRLTTIVLALCALRDLLNQHELDEKQKKYYKNIEEWLSDFDIETDETQVRLELQYEDSKDYLSKMVIDKRYEGERTSSIVKMQGAYECIKSHLLGYQDNGIDSLVSFARYFLTKIELVVIESENLSNALKIFETINQRGAGLNAMDLVKNLLFSEAKDAEFQLIKEKWKYITANLQACGEDQSPLRFLRYFMMARYHDGILREDEIYKWIISAEGKKATCYESRPLDLARELEKMSKRYSDLVNATMHKKDGGDYPTVTRIGFINKYKSRQHLILLLALKVDCKKEVIEGLAEQLESFFFFGNTLGVQAKYNERLFTQWAIKLRPVSTTEALTEVVSETILPYIQKTVGTFRQAFLSRSHWHYNPQYRQRYVLGALENTLLRQAGLPEKGMEFFDSLQIEHILPQTPKNDALPEEFPDRDNYNHTVSLLGNVTLLESTINQAVNKCNDLLGTWFSDKQTEYTKSNVISTALLNHEHSIGSNTQFNRAKGEYKYSFTEWTKKSISDRQQILLRLAFETWRVNGKRVDEVVSEDSEG
ncbi:DUF262 domain-containing HNH endonuclease family protein [Pontiellaceae bacterium B12227]|nr:DUF262 domain-containing HNH endonuclease family protein [Pontiellaceae bacterium B12227]